MTAGRRNTSPILASIVARGVMAIRAGYWPKPKLAHPGFMILIRINAAEGRAKSDTLAVHSEPFISEAGSEIPISIKPWWIHGSLVAI